MLSRAKPVRVGAKPASAEAKAVLAGVSAGHPLRASPAISQERGDQEACFPAINGL